MLKQQSSRRGAASYPGAFQQVRERLERLWFRVRSPGKGEGKTSFPASFVSTITLPMVQCATHLDRLQPRFSFSTKHLRRLGTRQDEAGTRNSKYRWRQALTKCPLPSPIVDGHGIFKTCNYTGVGVILVFYFIIDRRCIPSQKKLPHQWILFMSSIILFLFVPLQTLLHTEVKNSFLALSLSIPSSQINMTQGRTRFTSRPSKTPKSRFTFLL